MFCYWCKGSRTRTRQSERIKSIFRTTASKVPIHIDLTGSGSDSGTATIGGAATRGGHAFRGGGTSGAASRGGTATRGGHAFRGRGTSGAASRGGANPTADTATKGKRIVATVEKAIEILHSSNCIEKAKNYAQNLIESSCSNVKQLWNNNDSSLQIEQLFMSMLG